MRNDKPGCENAPKKVGDKSYMQFITTCVMKNWIVLEPIGDCDRYDCVIDRGNGFERVQVKTGRLKKGSVVFPACSSHYHTKHGQITDTFKRSYEGQVELFGVYCFETGKCYVVPLKDLSVKSAVSLRVDSTKNNQDKRIRWACEYEL